MTVGELIQGLKELDADGVKIHDIQYSETGGFLSKVKAGILHVALYQGDKIEVCEAEVA